LLFFRQLQQLTFSQSVLRKPWYVVYFPKGPGPNQSAFTEVTVGIFHAASLDASGGVPKLLQSNRRSLTVFHKMSLGRLCPWLTISSTRLPITPTVPQHTIRFPKKAKGYCSFQHLVSIYQAKAQDLAASL